MKISHMTVTRKRLSSSLKASRGVATTWGTLRLDAEEFEAFEKCAQTPQKPTKAILKGAEMLRALAKKSR